MAEAPSPAAPASPTPTDAKPPKPRIGALRMVWDSTRRYPAQIAVALVALTVAALATLLIPAGLKRIIDQGFVAGGGQNIDVYFYELFGVVALLGVATALRFYFVSWLGERTVADIRRRVQRNLLRQPPAFFEENRPSEIASRMTSDTAVIEQVVGTTISVALRNVVMGIGGTLYLFSLAPKLTAIMLVTIPIIILPIVVLGRRLAKIARASQDRVADVGAMTSETLGAMKVVQAFGQEDREAQRFEGVVGESFSTAKRRIALRAGMTSLVMLLIFVLHVYAAIWTRGTIRAMLYGTVTRAWAKQHHRGWYRKMTGDNS